MPSDQTQRTDCFGYKRWSAKSCRRCGYERPDCTCVGGFAAAETTLPIDFRYTVYASHISDGVPTLWDAAARRRDGSFVAGASGDNPADALRQLAKVLKDA